MYGGNTRIQMLVTDALTADDRLMRQAFRLFEISQRDSGAVSMNYPTAWLQESSTFSLCWAMMLGDYALWHGDAVWLRARMSAVRRWLSSVEGRVGADGLVRGLPGRNFVDWVPSWTFGVPPGGGPGEAGSFVHNLLCLLALRQAAAVEAHLGEAELAARGRRHADALAAAIARSDCHAWGSHPAYHLLTGVAGIRPDAAGFARVRVAPQPGGLRRIEAGVPSPRGLVRADLRFDGGRVAGTVTLPEGLPGVFAW